MRPEWLIYTTGNPKRPDHMLIREDGSEDGKNVALFYDLDVANEVCRFLNEGGK